MSRAFSLAGFEVTLIGRFWVTTEAESCFKRKIKFLDNSAFEQALAFLPGGAVRFHLRDTRIPRGDLSRGDVRVEIFHSVRQEHRSGDAAFSSAIGSRQHVNPWNPRHACAPLLPQPFQIGRASCRERG